MHLTGGNGICGGCAMEGNRDSRERAIGRRIAELRRKRGWKQDDLAARAGGVSRQVISKYERGHVHIAAVVLKDIADALNVPIATFFETEDRALSMAELMELPMTYDLVEGFWSLPGDKSRGEILVIVRTLADLPQRELPILAPENDR